MAGVKIQMVLAAVVQAVVIIVLHTVVHLAVVLDLGVRANQGKLLHTLQEGVALAVNPAESAKTVGGRMVVLVIDAVVCLVVVVVEQEPTPVWAVAV
jgi:hypothetical protein